MSNRHLVARGRLLVVSSVALLMLLLPATTLATNNSDAIDTQFSVSAQGCDVTLTAVAGEDEQETGSFAIYSGDTVMAEGEYKILLGETLSFGPYTLAPGSYLLVWDSEPGHDPSQSHSELAFEVSCAQPTPTPDGEALPTSGVKPTKRPHDPTLPPTDAAIAAGLSSSTMVVWPIALGIGLIAGIALLLTPAPVAERNRRRR